jgi:hypothetical protein
VGESANECQTSKSEREREWDGGGCDPAAAAATYPLRLIPPLSLSFPPTVLAYDVLLDDIVRARPLWGGLEASAASAGAQARVQAQADRLDASSLAQGAALTRCESKVASVWGGRRWEGKPRYLAVKIARGAFIHAAQSGSTVH